MIKRIALIWGVGILLFAGIMLFAQTPAPKPSEAPALEISTSIAIAAIEEKKKGLIDTLNTLQSQEQQVIAEWATQHKGWKIDPQQGFKVVKDEPAKVEKK